MANEALSRAIKSKGTQQAFADALGVRQSHVWYWLERSRKGAPAEYCEAIERQTGVPKHELRPDVFQRPVIKSNAADGLMQAHVTSASSKTEAAA